MNALVDDAVSIVQARRGFFLDGRPSGLATGFDDIDRLTDGMHPGEVILCAGRPAMGTTAYVLNVIEHVSVLERRSTAFFSTDLPSAEVIHLLASPLCEVEPESLRSGSLDQNAWDAFIQATAQLREARLLIDDAPEQTLTNIRSESARLCSDRLDLIVIDGALNLHAPSDPTTMLAGLKRIAQEFNVPILLTAMLGSSVDARRDHRPVIADLRRVGIQPEHVDTILFLYRDEYYSPDSPDAGLAEVIIAKQARCKKQSIKLAWSSSYKRLSNYRL